MKRWMCAVLAGIMVLLAAGYAWADQKVQLPDSKYSLTLPDEMEYDGPGTDPDTAKFAYVSEKLGLDINFFSYDAQGQKLKTLAQALRDNGQEVEIRKINGIEMLVYRVTDPDDPPEKGMKCIGYVLKDGDMIVETAFWYATKKAAKLTEEIISSIEE